MRKYYVYHHYRKDTGEIFYVGVGHSKRAYSKQSRNNYWHNIVNKCGYTIKIVKQDLTWEEACKEEKRLIKLYGRKDLGLGTLVNMTDGGDGTIGVVRSDEYKKNISIRMKKQNAKEGNPCYGLYGKEHPAYGNTFNEEQRKTISNNQMGEKNSFYGKTHTEETKKNMGLKRRGEKNGNTRLTKKLVLEIRKKAKEGINYPTLAKKYKVHYSTIFNIVHKKTWAHI